MSESSRIPGFYKLTVAERRELLRGRTPGSWSGFDRGGLEIATADDMVENVVGTYALPLAVALNFVVNGRDVLVPMATEEPSVVAAASNAARMVRAGGGFVADADPSVMVAQVQLLGVADPVAATRLILDARPALLSTARAVTPRLIARGGGARDLSVRTLSQPHDPDGGMLVVDVEVDCCDAMGANLVNSVAEALAAPLARLARATPGLRILTNLADRRCVRVSARVPAAVLACTRSPDGFAVMTNIVSASRFAELDPYRAATHNKGIMNGVDAVLLATGQDWRGVEAGAHAYASLQGSYRPLAVWHRDGDELVGRLEMPMAVGTVGGALRAHPGANLSMGLVGTRTSAELACVVAAAGLASNLAALRALATEGIQRGHMALHARALARRMEPTASAEVTLK